MARSLVQATWDDAPHLTEKQKADLFASIPPYQRDARTKGIPQLGSGAIYPIAESEITVDPFPIPDWYRKAYALDVGWNRTACVWGALDPETDVLYIYSEHYRGQAEPSVHAQAIRSRGDWIRGVIDPAARGRTQTDGQRLLSIYRDDFELSLTVANNAVEAGIQRVLMRMSTGRLKVFKTCQAWLGEFRIYRRDEKGLILKQNDHLMDATRYLEMSGLELAMTPPPEEWKTQPKKGRHVVDYDPYGQAWQPR